MKSYEKIRFLRKERGWTQQQLADKVGYTSKTSITRLEKGEVHLPQKRLKEFAKAFDVPATELMDDDVIQETQWGDDMANIEYLRKTDPELLHLYIELTRQDNVQVLFHKMKTLEPDDVQAILGIIDRIKKGQSDEL